MANVLFDRKKDEITAGFFNKDAFTEKKNLLLVLKTGIAGMNFHVHPETEEGKKILEKLKPGTELSLFRDPENPHDKWAVTVYTKDDEELGYITRFKNETIARLMDYGKKFIVKVDDIPEEEMSKIIKTTTEDFRLPFSIYMED